MELEWIKINVRMFDDEKLLILDSMQDNDMLGQVWMKLLLHAGRTNDNGKIYISKRIPYTLETLSVIMRRSKEDVEKAIKILCDLSLITVNKRFVITIKNWCKYQQNVKSPEKNREQSKERMRKKRKRDKENLSQKEDIGEEAFDNEILSDSQDEKNVDEAAVEEDETVEQDESDEDENVLEDDNNEEAAASENENNEDTIADENEKSSYVTVTQDKNSGYVTVTQDKKSSYVTVTQGKNDCYVTVTPKNKNKKKNKKENKEKKKIDKRKGVVVSFDDKKTDEAQKSAARLIAHFEKVIGQVGVFKYSSVTNMVEQYGEENVMKAINVAVDVGKVNLGYVEGILRNWARSGFPKSKGDGIDGIGEAYGDGSAFKDIEPPEPRGLTEEDEKRAKELI